MIECIINYKNIPKKTIKNENQIVVSAVSSLCPTLTVLKPTSTLTKELEVHGKSSIKKVLMAVLDNIAIVSLTFINI